MTELMSKKAWEHSGHAPGRSSCASENLWAVTSKFAQKPPDGGVFGSGVLRKVLYVTRTAYLTRILTRTAQAVSERARQSNRNVGVGERHGRPSQSKTRSAAQGAIGRLLRGLGELDGAGHVQQG